MPTPIYDALKQYAQGNPLRLHMPGHKGKPVAGWDDGTLFSLDVTEITPTGNLYEHGEPFDSAQALWAQACGFEWCQMLTCGSTQGIHTSLGLCCTSGDEILVDRGSHRSVFHAMALLDLHPTYLMREWLHEDGITGKILPETVEKALTEHPNIKTVCITSPTYYGVLSDVTQIADIVHRHGGRLVVDGAHGLHLPFLGVDAFVGADLVVGSAHKTLAALGQSAVLLGHGFSRRQVCDVATRYGTSSPSYPMLASLDLAREWMAGEGTAEYLRVISRVSALRTQFPSIVTELPLDPARLTVAVHDGARAMEQLETLGIFPEMASSGHVVFILTASDSDGDIDRLEAGLMSLCDLLGHREEVAEPILPETVLSLRQAMFSAVEYRPLEDCLGMISAGQLAPYPPGVPVVAPGERIGKKELAYCRKIGYNNKDVAIIK